MTYGIIKTHSGEIYVSPIFALKYANWNSEAVAFDETFSKIKMIKLYDTGFVGVVRNVFVIENDFDTSNGDLAGFDWVINNESLLNALRSKNEVDIELFSNFKNYCKKIHLPERFELKNDKDISSREGVSFGFHDSFIREYVENENSITVRFDTTWGCYITVIFEGVTDADFKEKVGQILDSEIKKTDDGFSFTVLDGFAGWIDGCDYDSEIGKPYIKCKKIFWQIEIA